MQIICCMKSKISYNRLKNNYEIHNWEIVAEFEDLQEKIIFNSYDIVVVDKKLSYFNEVITLFKTKDTKIIVFNGDFEIVENELNSNIKIESNNDKRVEKIYIEKVIEKEIKVETQIYKGIKNQTIGVINLSKSSGATFVALNLAKTIADYKVKSSIIELCESYCLFDLLDLKNKIEQDEYYSFHHILNEKKIIDKSQRNTIKNLSYYAVDSRKAKLSLHSWNVLNLIKIIYASSELINIVDLGYLTNIDLLSSISDIFDRFIIVLDANENNINIELLREINKIKVNGTIVNVIINKVKDNIQKVNLDYMDNTDYKTIPYIEDLKSNINEKNIKEYLKIAFSGIIRDVLPKELLSGDLENSIQEQNIISKNIQYISIGSNEIGFMGVESGVGVTHLSLMLAHHLSYQYKVALIEVNDSNDYENIRKIGEFKIKDNSYFKCKGVDYFININYIDFISKYREKYEYIIADFGSHENIYEIEEFLRMDVKMIVGQVVDWKIEKIYKFYSSINKQHDIHKNWKYLIPFMDSNDDISELTDKIDNPIYAIPFNKNPFIPTNEIKIIYDQMLGLKIKKRTIKNIFNRRSVQ